FSYSFVAARPSGGRIPTCGTPRLEPPAREGRDGPKLRSAAVSGAASSWVSRLGQTADILKALVALDLGDFLGANECRRRQGATFRSRRVGSEPDQIFKDGFLTAGHIRATLVIEKAERIEEIAVACGELSALRMAAEPIA